ncbi:hypothetical protein [Streptomyces californicus]|uniref:hypothetical protein n=1 Tax=Streptomyces californicus TaxID=67351 RepID=UPI00296E737F|nr:hypothetical protein [Streptomyces californicus]MDW4912632.1 hypothetical protein [Streptomyces californicus]
MSVLPLLHDGAALAAASAALYAASIAIVVAVSVLSASPDHRRDARETLKILLRRRR